MAVPRNDDYTVYGGVEMNGKTETINSQSIIGLQADPSGNLLLCNSATIITAGGAGYARGCQMILTGVTTTPCVYVNTGSATSCTFRAYSIPA